MKSSKIYDDLVKVLMLEKKDINTLVAKDYENLVSAISGTETNEGEQGGISDDKWNTLAEQTQNWVETGVKAISADMDIAPFSDIIEVKEEAKVRTRPRMIDKEPENKVPELSVNDLQEDKSYEIVIKEDEKLITHKGKIIEISRRAIFIYTDGAEQTITKTDVQKITLLDDALDQKEEVPEVVDTKKSDNVSDKIKVSDAEEGAHYKIGSEDSDVLIDVVCVRKTSKRGIFDEENGERHRCDLDAEIFTIDSIDNQEDKIEQKVDNKKSEVDKSEEVVEKEIKQPDKKTRKSSKGLSVGQRIREIVCEDSDLSIEDVAKILEGENLKCSDTTLSYTCKETKKVLATLKLLGKLNN